MSSAGSSCAQAEGDWDNEAVVAGARRRQPGPWARRALVVAVDTVILAVSFEPLPHVSLFGNYPATVEVSGIGSVHLGKDDVVSASQQDVVSGGAR